jgi:soluble lytic murein transglycosylase
MTVESSHNPWAISAVGARGLMQVMPHTGQLTADRLALPYFGPALLFEPEVAIELAAWYFRQLLNNFQGQLPLAMAAYNAGPHRVKVWLEFKGHLPLDELIEEIPYAQAREYAKKVTHHLALYRRIYEGYPGHLLDLEVNPRALGHINF